MSEININKPYVPATAENGKFAPLSDSTLSTLGLTAETLGKFAVLTYNINPPNISLSASTLNVSVCDISVKNWNDLIAETYTDQALSANVSITNVASAIITNDFNVPNTIWIATSTFSVQGILNSIPYSLKELEIQNKTLGSVFVLLSSTNYSNTINKGIEVESGTYYSTSKNISQLSIASVSGGDIRVIGHYRG